MLIQLQTEAEAELKAAKDGCAEVLSVLEARTDDV